MKPGLCAGPKRLLHSLVLVFGTLFCGRIGGRIYGRDFVGGGELAALASTIYDINPGRQEWFQVDVGSRQYVVSRGHVENVVPASLSQLMCSLPTMVNPQREPLYTANPPGHASLTVKQLVYVIGLRNPCMQRSQVALQDARLSGRHH
ncbi:hypothetical protein N658DRAFT_145602 [Parathielavia hyrcaniae]|uniref:Uncharacterized protein n=1 Tax=Parathielavia hyrcaniae TaxID=113614 RepID=A0AAN6PY09_9PEZI|nr:hypothetical protein N658DRAFT_145602 [Parathielavia hyrcaniae]